MYKINYRVNPLEYSKVIYGDSVTEDTPILLKNKKSGMVEIKNIKNIASDWTSYPGFKIFDQTVLNEKSYSLCDYYVWSDKGWANIYKVIRHKCYKKIYKITTSRGIVKVTEDHSLLSDNLEILKPKDCIRGIKLLEKYPYVYDYTYTGLNLNNCYTIGVMFAEGYYEAIPTDILNGSYQDSINFLAGYNSVSIKEKMTDLGLAGFYYINKKIFNDIEITYENSRVLISPCDISHSSIKNIEILDIFGEYVYDLETSLGRFQAGIGEIIVKNTDSCMIELRTPALEKYKEYLDEYKDVINLAPLQEEILQKAKTKSIEEAFEEGKKLSAEITTALFKKPINLEFEKVYSPYIILSKKRYLGNYYGKSPYAIDKVEKKGIVLQRRDNPDIVKRIYNGIISPLLDNGHRGIMISVNYLKDELKKLLTGQVDLSELVVTKALAKGYGKLLENGEIEKKDTDYSSMNLPHVALACNMRKKDPGSAPNIGDRISYLFTEIPGNPKAKLYEKVQDLESVKKGNLKVDYLYYLDNQIHNPVTEVLSILYPRIDDIFKEVSKEYRETREKEIKHQKIIGKLIPGQTSILRWLGKK